METVILNLSRQNVWADSPVPFHIFWKSSFSLGRNAQFLEGQVENSVKMIKRSNFPELRRGISQICPWNIRTPPLHFCDDEFASFFPKIGNKIEKTLLLDQFHIVPSTFKPLPPQNYWPSLLFYYTSLSDLVLTWISQNLVFIANANQKLSRKTFKGSSEGLMIQVLAGFYGNWFV